MNARGIHALSGLVAGRSGIAVAANEAIVGRNAFRHASGIHQDGVLKKRETFEWIDPAFVGNPHGTEIVRAGFAARARRLGIELADAGLESAFARFQVIADEKREPDDGDIRTACTAGAYEGAT